MSNDIIEKLKQMNQEGKLPFSFDNKTLKLLREGGQTFPLKADNIIIRIPKDRGHQTWQDLKRESKISQMLEKQQLKTKVSNVKLFINDDISFAYHQIVSGDILEGEKGEQLYKGLSEYQKELLAQDLAVFFAELHQIPLSAAKDIPPYADKPVSYDYEKHSDFNYQANKKRLQKYGIDLDRFRTPLTEDKVFCHNDLHGGNLAVDASQEHILNGIFDFGNADINNRSADFVKLCAMDRSLARNTIKHYNRLTNANVSMKEVDYQYLNWMAESIKGFEKLQLTDKQQAAVTHKFNRDLGLFRADVLKERMSTSQDDLTKSSLIQNKTNQSLSTQFILEQKAHLH